MASLDLFEFELTLIMINHDIFGFENNVEQKQLGNRGQAVFLSAFAGKLKVSWTKIEEECRN